MISRRGFLGAVAGLIASPSLIEKLKPEPLFGDGFYGWSGFDLADPRRDAYVAYYTSYSKVVTINREDMQRDRRTFVDIAQQVFGGPAE